MSRDVLLDGLLQGRIPGKKEFCLYYVELTTSQFHIFDGENGETRKHLHSMRIKSSDMSGIETKVRKGEFRFYYSNSKDGRYIFKVQSEADRENWISKFLKVINKEGLEKITGFRTPTADTFNPDNVGSSPSVPTRFDIPVVPTQQISPRGVGGGNARTLPGRGKVSMSNTTSVLQTSLPPVPGGGMMGGGDHQPKATAVSPRASIISTDSGIGTSVGGEVCRTPRRGGSKSTPNSGSAMFSRGGGGSGEDGGDSGSSGSGSLSHSADTEFRHRIKVTDEGTPKWFWGTLSRQDCEERLRTEGEMGNFVVRVNATGHYIMSFWRIDGIHHHKILNHDGIWRFEKAAVNAEGESLADLLDTYMKNCSKDRNIKPFGGGLFENYTYAWTPQEFDMDLLGKKLKEQKEKREKSRKPRKRQEYTAVELDSGMNTDEKFENDPQPPSSSMGGSKETSIKIKSTREKPLPAPPTSKKPPSPSHADPTPLKPATTTKKVLPTTPSAKPGRKQSNTQKSQGNSGSFARLQEIAKQGFQLPGQTGPSRNSVHQSAGAAAEPMSSDSQQDAGIMEPMYANTANPSAAQGPKEEAGDGYQNWEFKGPPTGTSTSQGKAALKPTPSAGTSKSQGKAALKPTPSASTTTTTTAAADEDNQYQNIHFQTNKSAKTKTSKPSPRPSSKSVSSAKKATTQQSAPQANASAYADDASVYQNVGFKSR